MLATKPHSIVSPSVEVARDIDTAADISSRVFLWVPDTPVLLECLRAVDGRSVVPPGGQDIVPSAIAGDGALELGSGRRVEGTVRLDDVVLDESIASPTVDGQVAVTVRVVVTGVVDGTNRWSVHIQFSECREVKIAYREADPGFHPFPPTRLPFPDHCRV